MITVAGWLFAIMRLSVIEGTAAFRFTGGQIEGRTEQLIEIFDPRHCDDGGGFLLVDYLPDYLRSYLKNQNYCEPLLPIERD